MTMCQCDPSVKTPFCGKPGCEWPEQAGPLKVVPISSKHTSGMTWSPTQLLTELLADILSDKVRPLMLAVSWMEETADGRRRPRYWQAGCSIAEQIAFLEAMKQSLIDDWRN